MWPLFTEWSERIIFMKPIYIEKCILVLKQVVLIVRMVKFTSIIVQNTEIEMTYRIYLRAIVKEAISL